MNSRYWNSLSSEERNKITNEWESSQWKFNALDDSKNNVVLGTGYYILLIFSIIFVFLYIAYFFFMVTYVTNYVADFEATPYNVAFILLSMIVIVFVILAIWTRESAKKQYLEEEKKKWLLQQHNIIK